jgi:hypothetical protein
MDPCGARSTRGHRHARAEGLAIRLDHGSCATVCGAVMVGPSGLSGDLQHFAQRREWCGARLLRTSLRRDEGTASSGEEARERWELTPEKFEMDRGKLFWDVGADHAVRLGDPEVWRAAVRELG